MRRVFRLAGRDVMQALHVCGDVHQSEGGPSQRLTDTAVVAVLSCIWSMVDVSDGRSNIDDALEDGTEGNGQTGYG
jgi:hypothetical protein